MTKTNLASNNVTRTRQGLCRVLAFCVGLAPAQALAETLYLCWRGNGGYTMTGSFSFPSSALGRSVITQEDITAFEITGFFEGRWVGSWSLAELTPDTSWLLRYDTQGRFFPLKGVNGLYQMWNANGLVNDCGTPGFGFNAGNGGQDVCIDGTYIVSSTIEWDTPITTFDAPQAPDCEGVSLLGKAAAGNLPPM